MGLMESQNLAVSNPMTCDPSVFRQALGSLAAFVGAGEIALSRVTPRWLRAPVRSLLRATARAGA